MYSVLSITRVWMWSCRVWRCCLQVISRPAVDADCEGDGGRRKGSAARWRFVKFSSVILISLIYLKCIKCWIYGIKNMIFIFIYSIIIKRRLPDYICQNPCNLLKLHECTLAFKFLSNDAFNLGYCTVMPFIIYKYIIIKKYLFMSKRIGNKNTYL